MDENNYEPVKRERKSAQRRQKKKKQRAWVWALLYVAFIIGASMLLGTLGWNLATDVLAFNKGDTTVEVTLSSDYFEISTEEAETTDEDGQTSTETTTTYQVDMGYVAQQLKDNGLIRYKWLFRLFVSVTGSGTKFRPGSYTLDTTMDYRALVTNMGSSNSNRATVSITFIEGSTVDQIFQQLEDNGVASVEDLQETAASYDFDYDFLEDLELGDYLRLEGYLFPDTYEFYLEESAISVLDRFLDRLDEIFTEELREQAEEMGYSVHEILTIASIIERETTGSDRATIASVIYNRLERPTDETLGYLNMDSTIYYVTGITVTVEDYQTVDSPYNTYLYTGLPPGPIANPGYSSIYAALNPEDTDYYYYTMNPETEEHDFSSTYVEHTAKINKYAAYEAEDEE
ncbi:MAG: endolytic transglycosylase MltG [Oscillospiraceae bacterium]|nr:endolytic transglycosylase MltG [Oscillospiraceae bacterium]